MSKTRIDRKGVSTILILLMTCIVVSGCYVYYYFSVRIADVRLSPIYRLDIVNKTSQVLSFLPRDGAQPDIKPMQLDVDGVFTTHLQVKEILIGKTPTREIVTGPYIDSGRMGPDAALILYRESSGRRREFQIDLRSGSWFDGYERTVFSIDKSEPRILKIELTPDAVDRDKEIKWFRKGPDNPV